MPTTPAEKTSRVRHHHHHHRRRSGHNNANPGANAAAAAESSTSQAIQQQHRHHHAHAHPPPPDAPEVVAALAQKSPHPYSSIALSPDRQYAVTASKDTLQILRIRASGLQLIKTLPIAHHFSSSSSNEATTSATSILSGGPAVGSTSVLFRQQPTSYDRDSSSFVTLFGQNKAPSVAAASAHHHHQSTATMNVVITDVAWSAPQEPTSKHKEDESWQDRVAEEGSRILIRDNPNKHCIKTTLIAAAASNGAIVVWNAEKLLQQDNKPAVPEAVLRQHVRAVNRLAWHPGTHAGLLLSASQDGKVLLWERQQRQENKQQQQQQQDDPQMFSHNKNGSSAAAAAASSSSSSSRFHRLFGGMSTEDTSRRSYTWQCRASFEPKSEAIRDIRWSPFYEDVFGLVTGSGLLIAYNMAFPRRALVKMTAHAGDATTLDWHPKRKGVIATGSAMDRCVKVWDLESLLSLDMDDANLLLNQNTLTSRADSIATADSSTDNESNPQPRGASPFSFNPNASRHRGIAPHNLLHVLSISASVTRVRWRPLASDIFSDDSHEIQDRHESMMAVATAPIKGASAGGAGLLMLWSWNRPFMPLSVVEGHSEGAVTDFHWLDTPTVAGPITPPATARKMKASSTDKGRTKRDPSKALSQTTSSRIPGSRSHESDAILFENSEHEDFSDMGVWQHVLSVGRDGRCIIQSFVRGDRPISLVPPSCFTMANLSPFQAGYGSLQIFSLCQNIPSGPRNQFYLTGLRRDIVTASAPGIFREEPLPDEESESADDFFPDPSLFNHQLPAKVPELHFNVIDQGDLADDMSPIITNGSAITVAPEVVHMSRFAERYEMYMNEQYKSRVELCMHNAYVAHSLKCEQLAEMWKMIAIMLDSSLTKALPESGAESGNVMQFILLPTIRSILEERADAGDVQTCVTLCEVLQVVTPKEMVKIPGLDIEIVREWYLSYIDLLQGMCLFSHATFLIRNTSDPYIAALNKQSTTIHESCPQCGKALSTDGIDSLGETSTARRLCRSCRRRIGFCFLCHEPVRGMYVWCPGCGHGGHLEHALQWFGGSDGTVREVCPTGCGHKCNMMQRLSAFPRTDSLKDFSPFGDVMDPL